MDFVMHDFNDSSAYFAGAAASEWADIQAVLADLKPHFQASGQAGIVGRPIFDPKGTNEALTAGVRPRGWSHVPVPAELAALGVDWDAGKASTLAEWQFSNYPFLWNNVMRTQAVVTRKLDLPVVGVPEALIVVTKSGLFPASNSTLYYEQAAAQLDAASRGAVSIPMRLVGLVVPDAVEEIDAVWSVYPSRYARAPTSRSDVRMTVTWTARPGKYAYRAARFAVLD